MVRCPNGHENPDGARFCNVCGSSIAVPTEASGMPAAGPPPPPPPPPSTEPIPPPVGISAPFWKRPLGILVLAVAGLLLLSGIVAALDRDPGERAAPSPSSLVEESAATEPSEALEPTTTPEIVEPEFTVSQENAIESAKSYLDFSAFSKSGLIDQLKFEGYSKADARFAVNHISVNWNEQAARSAKAYLDYGSFSRQGLIDQLKVEGFTTQQAIYGVNTTGL